MIFKQVIEHIVHKIEFNNAINEQVRFGLVHDSTKHNWCQSQPKLQNLASNHIATTITKPSLIA